MKRPSFVLLIIALVLLIDQVLKVWIKTHLTYGEEFGILGLSWARIHFVENEGMAFGLSFGGTGGKLALSLFRIFAVLFLVYIIRTLIRGKESYGLLACFALITAGAIGNIIDSAAYGLIFSESSYHGIAELFPEGGGYAGLLHGRVVDMLYFPVIDTFLPQWLPLWGGERFQFFKPVFNIADASISTGVISLLLFHRGFLRTGRSRQTEQAAPTTGVSVEKV
ncbi:MAG TPA: lipoprotein signal peptidase [Saprospiraceae bacterium]|nr:lipoprotein signal peptidase [Saprospiraceae bacterium]